MPNGGYPMNQFIQPAESSLVIKVHGTELLVYDAAAFRRNPSKATPLLSLTQDQTGALRSHLNYWFDYRAGYISTLGRPDGVSYDY